MPNFSTVVGGSGCKTNSRRFFSLSPIFLLLFLYPVFVWSVPKPERDKIPRIVGEDQAFDFNDALEGLSLAQQGLEKSLSGSQLECAIEAEPRTVSPDQFSEAVQSGFLKSPHEFMMRVNFHGATVPLKLSKKDDEITIRIVNGTSEDCLKCRVDGIKKTAHVDTIATTDLDCPIQAEKQGTYILDLVKALGKNLNLSEVFLDDASAVYCEKDGQITSLQFLRTMQKGKGWYEEQGYLPPGNYEAYRLLVQQLREYPLSELHKHLEQAKTLDLASLRKTLFEKQFKKIGSVPPSGSLESLNSLPPGIAAEAKKMIKANEVFIKESLNRAIILSETLRDFERSHSGSQNLASFFTWLWEKSCSRYIAVERLLFPDVFSSISDPPDLVGISSLKPKVVHLRKDLNVE